MYNIQYINGCTVYTHIVVLYIFCIIILYYIIEIGEHFRRQHNISIYLIIITTN